MRTWLSERFGLEVPVVCAPMAGAGAGELAAAVSRGGGLGMVGTGSTATPEWISEQCRVAATDTSTAYGRVFDIAQRAPWPREYGARTLRNRFSERWAAHEDGLGTDASAPAELASASRRGDYDTAPVYAGQGVALLSRQRPAAEVVAGLGAAQNLLQQAAQQA
jgi:nitronate monooxygenase